jgi:hypothetical protein
MAEKALHGSALETLRPPEGVGEIDGNENRHDPAQDIIECHDAHLWITAPIFEIGNAMCIS